MCITVTNKDACSDLRAHLVCSLLFWFKRVTEAAKWDSWWSGWFHPEELGVVAIGSVSVLRVVLVCHGIEPQVVIQAALC